MERLTIMTRWLGLSFALASMPLASGERLAPKKGPRLDAHGDPLPDAAVARLGSLRFFHGGDLCAVAVSPYGNCVYSAADDFLVRRWPAKGAAQE